MGRERNREKKEEEIAPDLREDSEMTIDARSDEMRLPDKATLSCPLREGGGNE
ncbi:hypothetical protein ACLOJK_017896 [Asimina triloba]